MNIAIVGGGHRCKELMEVIERHRFKEIHPKVVAVAEINPQAPGMVKAVEQGLYVTPDYNDLFDRDDIELIIELTGYMEIYNDILKKKKYFVRAISSRTARLFWEISRISTLQKKTDQKLHEARAMYKTVFNKLIQEDVMVIGFDHRILDINESMLKKLGLTREEVIGKPCYEITHHQSVPCSGDQHPCPLVKTLETEKPFQTTHVHKDKNGRDVFFSISTYPLLEGDDVIGAIEISRDITKEMKMQKVMMHQEKLASIGRLSAGVAHEINNPLTTILTTAMLIQEDLEKDDPVYEELQTITNETLRCRKIVTSLLNFARQTKPSKKIVDPGQVVLESITLTQKQAAFKDVEIEFVRSEGIPAICLDPGQIQQALINLIINAVEATDPGGKITLHLQPNTKKGVVEIRISDTGCGIDPDTLNNIVDPFFTTKEEGTGLGLAITHGIVEQHGGSLDVKSEVGKGTTFIIGLPLDQGESHGT